MLGLVGVVLEVVVNEIVPVEEDEVVEMCERGPGACRGLGLGLGLGSRHCGGSPLWGGGSGRRRFWSVVQGSWKSLLETMNWRWRQASCPFSSSSSSSFLLPLPPPRGVSLALLRHGIHPQFPEFQ